MVQQSNKAIVRTIVNTLALKGLKYVVCSPGSRNAPLLITFNQHPAIICLSIVDERSAAFFALGLSQFINAPVGMLCTSGSASYNYAPAVAEAFFQQLPLVVMTADRPTEYIYQGFGQSIDQNNIYHKHVLQFFQMPKNSEDTNDIWYANRMTNEAYNLANGIKQGPVHINIPLSEPLYETVEVDILKYRTISNVQSKPTIDPEIIKELKKEVRDKKVMILLGFIKPNTLDSSFIDRLTSNPKIVVLTESLSNIQGGKHVACIDRTLAPISILDKKLKKNFLPDILITTDGAIVSKRIKNFLSNKEVHHWHISESATLLDTFKRLTKVVHCNLKYFIEEILLENKFSDSTKFKHDWMSMVKRTRIVHQNFLKDLPFCDLYVFQLILSLLDKESHLQLGNSSVVRYVQLFDDYECKIQLCNRGTSGIEGNLSTACGYAYLNQEKTIMIIGDISFFYDNNSLWNNYLSKRLTIILINNSGGNIFKIIDGPDQTNELEDFFVHRHSRNAKEVAASCGIKYQASKDKESLRKVLTQRFNQKQQECMLIEIFTPENSSDHLRKYFDTLKSMA